MKLRKSKKGFTIVELVIVIAVIGILSAILIPTFVNLTSEARKKELQANLRNAYTAYIAEAADGVLDVDGTTKIELVAEKDATLKKESDLYHMNDKGEWVVAAAAEPTESAGVGKHWALTNVSTTDDNSRFNGYIVQYYTAVNDYILLNT